MNIRTTFTHNAVIVFTLVLLVASTGQAAVRYVTATGAGTGTGSWANASNDLQQMLYESVPGDEIWIAEGTYKPIYTAANYDYASSSFPTADGGRDNAFVLVEGVRLYGGFVPAAIPSGVTLPDFGTAGRDGLTQLSGDINNDGSVTGAYHVVIGVNIANDGATLMDGLTVSGGNANGSSPISVNGSFIGRNTGGGMYNANASPTLTHVTISGNSAFNSGGGMINFNLSSPTLTHVTISDNITRGNGHGGGMHNFNSSPTLTQVIISANSTTGGNGGGMYNDNSSPTLTRVTISANSTTGSGGGGGMYNNNSSPTLTDVAISANIATNGGGMYNSSTSSPMLTNVAISGNSATGGGTVGNGGGMYNSNSSSPTLTNVAITGNSATNTGGGSGGHGGGMFNYTFSSAVMTNVTVSGNSATGMGGGMYNYMVNNQVIIANNSIIWENTSATSHPNVFNQNSNESVFTFSLVQRNSGTGSGWDASLGSGGVAGIDAGGTNLPCDADPLFVAYEPASSAPSTAGDYRLQAGSPCIDAGDNALYLAAQGIPDFTGETDLAGAPRLFGTTIDMGAYERTATVPGAPQNFTVTATGGQATLTWDPPASDGGSPVTKYQVQKDGDGWIDVPAGTIYAYPGLTAGTAYIFQVRAVNATGDGAAAIVPIVAPVKLYYDGNDDALAPATAVPVDGTDYAPTASATILSGVPARTGYVFIAWTDAALPDLTRNDVVPAATLYMNGGVSVFHTTTVTGNATVVLGTTDMKLYALWGEDVNRNGIPDLFDDAYTVTYDANGGYGTQTDPLSPYLSGVTVTVLDTGTMIRAHYVFTCWNTRPDGRGDNYYPGDSFTITEHVVLYALWKEETYIDPTIQRLITIAPTLNGRVVSNRQYAATRETVTLTILPESGYLHDSITVHNYHSETTTVPLMGDGDTRTFVMPPYQVIVRAIFKLYIQTGAEEETRHAASLRAYAHDGMLHVSGLAAGEPWCVYNLLGVLVYQGIAVDETAKISLPARGIYIVAHGRAVLKIVN